MAYNVLKGMVEGSVDQHADQEIEGVKVFKSTVSASVFYDTDAQAPCITANDLPIKYLQKESPRGIVIYTGNQNAETHHDFQYRGKTLYVPHVCSVFEGDGSRLVNLPADRFEEKIPSTSLKLGLGLESMREALQVRASSGIFLDEEGVGIGLAPNSGLAFKNRRLLLDVKSCDAITKNGQNLSDDDTFFVYDASLNQMRTSTLDNFCSRYISEKLPRPTGDLGSLQLKGRNGLAASNELTFDDKQKTLIVDGTVKSHRLKSTHSAEFLGPLRARNQICAAIKHVNAPYYEVEDEDYTLLLNSGKENMEVVLPPASNNEGRILILKKTNHDKYKLNSGVVRARDPEGKIDISDQIVIKMNYSLRMIQSDGKNWWIIGSKGT